MNHRTGISFLLILGLVLTGCTTIRGFPEAPRASNASFPDSDFLLGKAALDQYTKEADTKKKKILRNEILDARIEEIDKNFGEFERALYKQGIGWGIGTDWVLLGLTAATAIIGGESTKTALAAASTAVVGAQASFDKRALFDKSLPALMAQMVAQRETIRASIKASEQLSIENYTVYAGLSDLQRFEFAGSIPGSLQSISQDAGQKAAAAKEEIKDITKGIFMKSKASDLLRKFWKPDGKTADKDHQERLEAWMKENHIATDPGSISMFLYASEFEDLRKKAVQDLGTKGE